MRLEENSRLAYQTLELNQLNQPNPSDLKRENNGLKKTYAEYKNNEAISLFIQRSRINVPNKPKGPVNEIIPEISPQMFGGNKVNIVKICLIPYTNQDAIGN